MLFLSSNAQFGYTLDGRVVQNKKPLEGAIVELFRDSIEIQKIKTGVDGKFSVAFQANNEYTVSISKEGYITKKLFFSLKGFTNEEAKNFNGGTKPDIQLFEMPANKNLSAQLNILLANPVAKFNYDHQLKDIVFDKEYAKEKTPDMERIRELQKSLEIIESNPIYSQAREFIEKLLGENEVKATEIGSLQKDKEIKDLELLNNENQLKLLSQSKTLQEIKLNAQKDEILKQNLLSEKQKKDLELLEQGKQIQGLSIKNKEQELKQSQFEIQKQKQQKNYFIIGLIIILGFAGFIFRSLRQRNKQNKIITEQKVVVEEKQKEILDSIEYALRIQTAILPPQKVVKQYLENSFILYKPKDIVAGDFYWMETINDLILFAACDCTGHGVPGAMVSVVCHNALNRAVREFGLTQPAAILDKTTEIVIENFSKSEEDIKDGMDISLCAFNPKTKTIQWAGANNALWLIQNNELLETKADKQPIGMNEDHKPFTNHSFTLNMGDSIYLFTDGFADQFGGETGDKKLTRKRFKELLLGIQNKSMQDQGVDLDKFIVNYRKEVEQIDDILVMGVTV